MSTSQGYRPIASVEKNIAGLFASDTFEPAPVQREFQWQDRHTRRLLEDLVEAFQRFGTDPDAGKALVADDAEPAEMPSVADPDDVATEPLDTTHLNKTRKGRAKVTPPEIYFLGGIILFREKGKSACKVYDGLQRLTSLCLLLAKLRDSWVNKGDPALSGLKQLLAAGPSQYRLRFPTTGHTLIETMKEGGKPPSRELTEGDKRMRDAARYFDSVFTSTKAPWSDGRRAAFVAFVQLKIFVAVTEVDNPSLAYQMFVTANSRGLSLSVGDIAKGELVELVNVKGGSQTLVNETATLWRNHQRLLRKGFEDFLAAVEVVECNPLPSDKFSPGELLCDNFSSVSKPEEIRDWVRDDMGAYAAVFAKARAHLDMDDVAEADLAFRQLSFLGWKDWQPFYLAFGRSLGKVGQRTWTARIRKLQRACYIIELLDWWPQTRRAKFIEAIEQLSRGVDPFTGAKRTDGTFENGKLGFGRGPKEQTLLTLNGPFNDEESRGAVVRWIETLHHGPTVSSRCTNDGTVEHVLPQTAIAPWPNKFNEVERERYTNRLGNLFILDDDANNRVGNAPWPAKEVEYTKWTSRFKVVHEVLAAARTSGGSTDWSPAAVEALTAKLARKAQAALWP